MERRVWLAAALVCATLALVLAEDAFHVNDGSGNCVPASIGDCVACSDQGEQYSVKPVRFEHGTLVYAVYRDSECHVIANTQSRGAALCSDMPSCTAAAVGIALFEVEAMSPLKVSCLAGSYGVVSMNVTSAHSIGRQHLLVYSDTDGNSIQYQRTENGTFVTTAGSCPYDQWCTAGELSYRLAIFPFGPEFAAAHAEITAALHGLTADGDPMAALLLETYSYSLSTTDRNVFVIGEYGPSVPSSKLPSVVLEFPIAYTMTNMKMDTTVPTLSATVDWNGLGEREREFNCDYYGETSFADPIIECSFSLAFQATDEPRMFDSYAAIFDAADEQDLALWDQQPAFALFL